MLLFSSLLLLLLTRVASIRRLPTHFTSGTAVNTTITSTARQLKLKSVHVPTPSSREDHRVTSLPYLANNTFTSPHYAGLLPANADKTKYLFYWLFQADGSADSDTIPLILWLNGGPGCSSMDGLFLEHGPLKIVLSEQERTWSLQTNPHSWHTAPAHVVYVDQPVGTGLSFTTTGQYPSNDEQVNQDFYYWLKEFFTLHAELFLTPDHSALKLPFYFSGESHAGHYIPSMMNYIHRQQQQSSTPLKIKIDGAAIGNGWVDPFHQYAAAQAAYGHGLIDLAQKNALDQRERICQEKLSQQNFEYGGCFSLLDDVVAQSQGRQGSLKISQYDARNWEPRGSNRIFPLGHERIESYLGGWPPRSDTKDPPMTDITTEEVLTSLHAMPSREAGQRYQECTDPPYMALAHQDGLGVVRDVVELLESGTKLLFFNGIHDLICNHVGNEVMLTNLPWSKRDDWIQSSRYSWTLSSNDQTAAVVGYVKEYENLQYLKVLDSGHMVPMDVPHVALEMIRIFVSRETSFSTSKQVLGNAQDAVAASCPVCPNVCNTATESDNDEDNNANTPSLSMITVSQSWIGALGAVALFLGVFLYKRKQQQQQDVQVINYGNLEMKEGVYRDEPLRYRDDNDDEEVKNGDYRDEPVQYQDDNETNGDGIII